MNAASIQRNFEGATPFSGPQPEAPFRIKATPFRWPAASTLPRRPWVFGRWLLRQTVSAIVSPGGVGKSSFVASMLLSLASGREDVLGKTVWGGPKTVWYWNLEDTLPELEMQFTAASMFHRVTQEACGNRVYIDSGPEGSALCIAVEDREGFKIAVPVVEALIAELKTRRVDVLVIDPFVSSHAVSENDNGAIDAVAKVWARIAKERRANPQQYGGSGGAGCTAGQTPARLSETATRLSMGCGRRRCGRLGGFFASKNNNLGRCAQFAPTLRP